MLSPPRNFPISHSEQSSPNFPAAQLWQAAAPGVVTCFPISQSMHAIISVFGAYVLIAHLVQFSWRSTRLNRPGTHGKQEAWPNAF